MLKEAMEWIERKTERVSRAGKKERAKENGGGGGQSEGCIECGGPVSSAVGSISPAALAAKASRGIDVSLTAAATAAAAREETERKRPLWHECAPLSFLRSMGGFGPLCCCTVRGLFGV